MNDQQYTPTTQTITLVPGKNTDRIAVASFVCGILSMVFLLCGVIPAFAPAYLGYSFYSDATRRGSTHRLLTAAQTMCIIGLVLSLIAVAVVIVVFILAIAGMATFLHS